PGLSVLFRRLVIVVHVERQVALRLGSAVTCRAVFGKDWGNSFFETRCGRPVVRLSAARPDQGARDAKQCCDRSRAMHRTNPIRVVLVSRGAVYCKFDRLSGGATAGLSD